MDANGYGIKDIIGERWWKNEEQHWKSYKSKQQRRLEGRSNIYLDFTSQGSSCKKASVLEFDTIRLDSLLCASTIFVTIRDLLRMSSEVCSVNRLLRHCDGIPYKTQCQKHFNHRCLGDATTRMFKTKFRQLLLRCDDVNNGNKSNRNRRFHLMCLPMKSRSAFSTICCFIPFQLLCAWERFFFVCQSWLLTDNIQHRYRHAFCLLHILHHHTSWENYSDGIKWFSWVKPEGATRLIFFMWKLQLMMITIALCRWSSECRKKCIKMSYGHRSVIVWVWKCIF